MFAMANGMVSLAALSACLCLAGCGAGDSKGLASSALTNTACSNVFTDNTNGLGACVFGGYTFSSAVSPTCASGPMIPAFWISDGDIVIAALVVEGAAQQDNVTFFMAGHAIGVGTATIEAWGDENGAGPSATEGSMALALKPAPTFTFALPVPAFRVQHCPVGVFAETTPSQPATYEGLAASDDPVFGEAITGAWTFLDRFRASIS